LHAAEDKAKKGAQICLDKAQKTQEALKDKAQKFKDSQSSSSKANPAQSAGSSAAKVSAHKQSPSAQPGVPPTRKSTDENVAVLCGLGFSPAAARHALSKCGGNVEASGEWLMDESNADEILAADMEGQEQGMLRVGTVATVVGLTGASDLNGVPVVLQEWDQQSQRWHVKLPEGHIKAIKKENLEAFDDHLALEKPAAKGGKQSADASNKSACAAASAEERDQEAEELRMQIRILLGGTTPDTEVGLRAMTIQELIEVLNGLADENATASPDSTVVDGQQPPVLVTGKLSTETPTNSESVLPADDERALRLQAAEQRQQAARAKMGTMEDWKRQQRQGIPTNTPQTDTLPCAKEPSSVHTSQIVVEAEPVFTDIATASVTSVMEGSAVAQKDDEKAVAEVYSTETETPCVEERRGAKEDEVDKNEPAESSLKVNSGAEVPNDGGCLLTSEPRSADEMCSKTEDASPVLEQTAADKLPELEVLEPAESPAPESVNSGPAPLLTSEPKAEETPESKPDSQEDTSGSDGQAQIAKSEIKEATSKGGSCSAESGASREVVPTSATAGSTETNESLASNIDPSLSCAAPVTAELCTAESQVSVSESIPETQTKPVEEALDSALDAKEVPVAACKDDKNTDIIDKARSVSDSVTPGVAAAHDTPPPTVGPQESDSLLEAKSKEP